MNAAPAKLWIYKGDNQDACIRIEGQAKMQTGVDLKKSVELLVRLGKTHLVLDLEACVQMDSTFLGTLADFVIHAPPGQSTPTIELLNPSERVLQVIDNLNVLNYFKVIRGPCALTQQAEPEAVAAGPADRKTFVETSRAAHLALMKADPRNRAKFTDVATFLEQELIQIKANEAAAARPTQA